MAKQKQSFFEKLAEKNNKHDEAQKTTPKQAKRNKKAYILLAALGLVVAGAITIPLVVTSLNVKVNEKMNDSDVVAKIKNADGSTTELKVSELLENVANANSTTQEKIDQFYKQVIFYLYYLEANSSREFQRLWNASRYQGESEKTDIALKTLSDVKELQKSKVNDLKRNIQKNYGLDNWQKQFTQTLLTDAYGKSSTEQEAIDYLTYKAVERDALRRFSVDNLNQTLFKELKDINRVANNDIYELDANGNTVIDSGTNKPKILVSKGSKVFPTFELNKNYFVNEDTNQVIVLKTASYDQKTWNDVEKYVEDYLNSNNTYVLSMFSLTGTKPSNITGDWKVDKEKLANTLFYSNINNNAKSNIELVQNFKSLEEYVLNNDQKQALTEYENYLNLISVDEESVKSNLGSLGLQTANSLIQNKNTAISLSTLTSVFESETEKLPTISLKELFKFNYNEATQAKIDQILGQLSSASETESPDLVLELNKLISNYLVNLSDNQINKQVTEMFNKQLVKEVNGEKYWSVAYNIAEIEGAKLIPSSSGLSIVKYSKIDSLDKFKELMYNDLANLSQGKTQYFKTLNYLGETATHARVVQSALNSESFLNYIKEQTNSSTNEKYTDENLTDFNNLASSLINGEKLSKVSATFKVVADWLKTQINSNTSYNVRLKDSQYHIAYNKETGVLSEDTAKNAIYNTLAKELNAAVKGGK
ncbi:HinT-interacting membrane complex protein P80 [Mycoplasma sp. Ms02]|uniref:HinT-interacting membrane complex protein P80 n=1 Tax=Mycoplasma sp. Ms02 TaxID=353851 RepID=UPI001C8A0452|nr:hypothetical protein [Mycoplasma sp. Ms02]QZE12113.1 hypothetical protein K4L35_02025 [Mycoplasma sp. Ms02]